MKDIEVGIRKVALKQAIKVQKLIGYNNTSDIMNRAKAFEEYLKGELLKK